MPNDNKEELDFEVCLEGAVLRRKSGERITVVALDAPSMHALTEAWQRQFSSGKPKYPLQEMLLTAKMDTNLARLADKLRQGLELALKNPRALELFALLWNEIQSGDRHGSGGTTTPDRPA